VHVVVGSDANVELLRPSPARQEERRCMVEAVRSVIAPV
jgi:hypothetical protein